MRVSLSHPFPAILAGLVAHETHHWGYFLRTKPSNEDYFFERRKVLNCSNAFVVAVLLQTLR